VDILCVKKSTERTTYGYWRYFDICSKFCLADYLIGGVGICFETEGIFYLRVSEDWK
jgi:hypothetical protein